MSFLNLGHVFSFLNQVCPENLLPDLENQAFPDLSIDTRKILPAGNKRHTIFIAIKGEQTDGHEYVLQAAKQGAIGAIISDTYVYPETVQSQFPKDFFLIRVNNTQAALIQLAKCYRAKFSLPVVGITGSCGKTTVKEMTAQILERVGPTLKTEGNYNNEIGLPLTILKLKQHHQFAVIEMGARHVGDIKTLSDIAKPTLSVVTLVASAHLEIFKTIENIAKTKGEIYHGLSKTGFAIINRDEPCCDYFIHSCVNHASLVTFGLEPGVEPRADYFASEIKYLPMETAFLLHTPIGQVEINLPIPGKHQVANALAAASLAGALGVSLEHIQAGLNHFSTLSGRMNIKSHPTGAVIIDDTYNANPASLLAAMEVLARYPGKKCLILGDMGELGDQTEKCHFEMGEKAKTLGIHYLFTVGILSEQASKAFDLGAAHLSNQAAIISAVKKLLDKNFTVLVKGSRSAGMEKVVNGLISQEQEQEQGQAACFIG